MRVSSNSLSTSLVAQLGSLASRQARLQNQAATGSRLQAASDDPAAARRVLDLRAETQTLSQYRHNISRQQDVAGASFSAVQSLKRISDRANEIATLADGLKSPQELAIYAREIGELIRHGVQTANTKHRGEFLFAGTRADQAPFALKTGASGAPTEVAYLGNTEVAEVDIGSGVSLTSQTPGESGGGGRHRGLLKDAASGADLFGHLISLQRNLQSGNTAAIANQDKPALARDEENLIYHLGSNGAIQSRLEAATAIAAAQVQTLDKQVSDQTDADLVQTLVRLNETTNAYQAALQSGGKLLNLSLMDFLR